MNKRNKVQKNKTIKVRQNQRRTSNYRLCVDKSSKNMYAQIIKHEENASDVTVLAVSTLTKDIKSKHKCTGNVEAAKEVGKLIASMAKKAGISKVAFDRSGFKYHGRIAALAMGARDGGLEF